MRVAAIIPAAGLGTRMRRAAEGAEKSPKQFLRLDGSSILMHTVRKFVACPSIGEIIVALRAQDRGRFEQELGEAALARPVVLVEGGRYRQESVRNGLERVSPGVELVAVHDAVRPCVPVELIERVIQAAARTGAAIPGLPPVETVKQVENTRIRTTLPRERIVLAQTPQVFRLELLRRAYQQAEADEFVGTDEASLVEHLEVDVSVVPGSDRNIKITRQSDLALAQLFLREAAGDHG